MNGVGHHQIGRYHTWPGVDYMSCAIVHGVLESDANPVITQCQRVDDCLEMVSQQRSCCQLLLFRKSLEMCVTFRHPMYMCMFLSGGV